MTAEEAMEPETTPSAFAREQATYLDEAAAIIAAAESKGIELRLLGAIAVIKHCPGFIWLHEATHRELTDIDFAAYSREQREVNELLTGLGYASKGGGGRGVTMEVWTGREIYVDPHGQRHSVDVFYDKLDFCHPVEFKGRLALDSPTIPLADIVLEKLQIVEVNEKDLKDLMILFLEHPVATGAAAGQEEIDGDYIAKRFAGDWGFYYTANLNFDKMLAFLPRYQAFTGEHRETIAGRIAELREAIERKPKSTGWKMRARIGPRKKWYRDVAEEYRELHDTGLSGH
ncbi:MAG: hypothetical protein ICV74_04690 [Thermoleophilia bacterium]|nr:hypothetical protein [Thermoleophilia bacterium]